MWKLDLMSLPWYGNEVSDHRHLSALLVEYLAVGSLPADFPDLCSPWCLFLCLPGSNTCKSVRSAVKRILSPASATRSVFFPSETSC